MAGDAPARKARWKATVLYRADAGLFDVPMLLAELGDLHDRIEAGPHWDTIVHIVVERMNHNTCPTLTIEQAKEL